MQELVDSLVADGFVPGGLPLWVAYLGAMLVFGGIVVFVFILPIAGVTTWVERRVAGRIQSRIGPNRTGPAGFLQWLADGIKSVLKEDIVPSAADVPLFKLAPYVVMTGFVAAFVVVPFGGPLIIADLNVGILYLTAVTALVVVGILMAGWASNNKWSLLGGWQIPLALADHPVPRIVLQFAIFFAKAYFWVFVAVWLRWTLPRIRVDQMMIMCWKYLVPIAFVNFMGTAVWMVLFPAGVPAVRVLLSLTAAGLLVAFARRVVFHVRRALLTREELSFNPLSTARVMSRG